MLDQASEKPSIPPCVGSNAYIICTLPFVFLDNLLYSACDIKDMPPIAIYWSFCLLFDITLFTRAGILTPL